MITKEAMEWAEKIMTPEAELAAIVAKQTEMREKHMQKYRNWSATRAQTTTLNANISRLQERAVWLRSEIKKAAA